MKAIICLLPLLLLTGCPNICKEMPTTLTHTGTPAPGHEKVEMAFQQLFGYPIVGVVHWVDLVLACGTPTPPWKYAGCQYGICGIETEVLYLPNDTHHNSIYRTAYAHEICHWAEPSYNEKQADECSAKIHALAVTL